ncbi:helix-turn-helix domain-containing protein [Nemorincola caseinilytica]|uniref:Helix-turn-helix domain-containing protein n=1 Tax=Nemorincola caseinilytica TaxID=2054315 RepID=A0ABP8NIJ0_9BACT
MVHISILVPYTAVPAAIVDPRYMFTAVNGFLVNAGKEPLFHVQLVGLAREVSLNDGLFTIRPDVLVKDVKKTDLVIVPAISGDVDAALDVNEELLPWIVDQYHGGAEVASLCIGAFLLAATGLMDGKACSTHWLYADLFREMFPEVQLVDDKIITEQNRLYSSGGANSYWNLLLYLVEKHTDREMAILASKYFVIETMRNSQSPFIIFKSQKTHKDETIRKAQEYIEQHYMDRISVEQLADMLATGRRSLERRFKAATTNTVAEYIQRVKMEAAKKSFETRRDNINEVMYSVGYTDPKAFRSIFRKVTGLSPVEYRNKYRRSA